MQVQRRHQPSRFRPRHLAYAIVVLALGVGAWAGWRWLSDPAYFPVRSVVVEGGREHVPMEQVLALVKPVMANGFVRLDPDQVRVALKKLPWVDDVAVWREWPDQVRIRVIQQRAVAYWAPGGQRMLVNGRGELFQVPLAQVPGNLPALQGPQGQQQKMLTQLQDLNHMMRGKGLWVSALSLDARGAWRCTLNRQIQVALGRTEPFARLESWLVVYPRMQAYWAPNTMVDLRYTNGFAFQRGADKAGDKINE